MKLEKQLCNITQGKRLKELGVNQGSYFRWYSFRNVSSPKSQWHIVHNIVGLEDEAEEYYSRSYLKDIEDFPAFTVAELGIMLPDLLETHLQYELVCIKESDDEWACRYVRNNDMCDLHPTAPTGAAITEAQTRAEILISLLEEKLTTSEEVNQRLLADN